MGRPLLLLIMVLWASSALAQPVNEWTIQRPTYTVKGDGIAYNDGTWKETDYSIDYSNPTKWSVETTHTPWEVNSSNLTLSMGRRGHTKSTIAPDGVFWLNTTTWAVTAATTWAVPVVTKNPTSVFMEGILSTGDGNAELFSSAPGPTWDYVFNDTTGWTANPYPPAESALIVRYQLGKNHTITVDNGQAVDWNGTSASQVEFTTAGETFLLATVEATDGNNDRYPITYYLERSAGKDWFMEGISAVDFAAAALPVRYHYTSKSGTASGNESWSGTIFLDPSFTLGSGWTLDVAAGTIIKGSDNNLADGVLSLASGAGLTTFSGTEESPVILTSCSDDTVGDLITSEANCNSDSTPAAGDWRGINCAEDFTGDFFVIRYGGADITASLKVASDAEVDLSNFVIENHEGNTWALYHISSTGLLTKVIDNFLVDCRATMEEGCVYIDYQATSGTFTMRNGIVVTDVASSFEPVFEHFDSASAGAMDIDNITVICENGSDTNTGFRDRSSHANDSFHNISVHGCQTAFHGEASQSGSHDYNNASGATTAFDGFWVQAANETTLAAGYSAATVGTDFAPSWADDYHIASGGNLEDAGSTTAATLGLDATHTLDDGTVDSGTVDIGFHFFTTHQTGGGSSPVAIDAPGIGWRGASWGTGFDDNGDSRFRWGHTNWGNIMGRW